MTYSDIVPYYSPYSRAHAWTIWVHVGCVTLTSPVIWKRPPHHLSKEDHTTRTDKEIREWVKVMFGHLPKAQQREIRGIMAQTPQAF
jgi:hypothetical protein